MAYGVDAYGRPQADDPAMNQQRQADQQRQQRQNNMAPQQNAQQPAQQPSYGNWQQQMRQPNDYRQPQQQSQQQQPAATGPAALYAKYGVQDGGRGSGFTDGAYWNEQAAKTGGWSDYWQNRLDANLAGHGTDSGTDASGQYHGAPAQGGGGYNAGYAAPGAGMAPAPQMDWSQAAYNPYQFDTSPMSTYHAGTLPTENLPTYMAAQLAQYGGANNGQLNGSIQGLMSQVLAHPESMSDTNVAQLKEQQKEQALSMQQQLQAQGAQGFASNGMLGSGAQQAQDARSRDNTLNSLIGSYRGIDLQKMQQDRADQLNAIGAGQGVSGMMQDQALGNYGATLQGQESQANQNYLSNQSDANRVQFGLGRALSQEGLNQAQVGSEQNARRFGFDVQQAQAQQNQAGAASHFGINQAQLADQLARSQMGQQNNQFYSQLGQQGDQFNNNLAFGYAGLNQNAQNQLISQILGY